MVQEEHTFDKLKVEKMRNSDAFKTIKIYRKFTLYEYFAEEPDIDTNKELVGDLFWRTRSDITDD